MTRKRLIFGLVILVAAAMYLSVHHSPAHVPASSQGTAPSKTKPAPTAAPANQDAALQQIIATWAGQQSSKTAVVVIELTGSARSASYNPTASMVPASTYKIFVAYAVLHAIEQHTYTLHTTLADGNTIEADLDNMILNSNNDAARALGFLIGWKNINALLQAHGAVATDLYNYVPPSTQPVGDKHTTATDLATILRQLYAGKLLSKTDTQLLLGLMERQHYRERIPAGVPSGVTVANKPGWLSPADGEATYIENDAAIVYGPKSTYLLVIMTAGNGSTQPLADLSQQVYDYLET